MIKYKEEISLPIVHEKKRRKKMNNKSIVKFFAGNRDVWKDTGIMRKWGRRLLSTVLAFSLAAVSVCYLPAGTAGTAQAASKNAKAKKIYDKILRGKVKGFDKVSTAHYPGEFMLIDINRDGISELIYHTYNASHPMIRVVAYVSGKPKLVFECRDDSGCVCYPKKHIFYHFYTHSGDWTETYYKFTGKKMKRIAEKYGSDYYNAAKGRKKTKKELKRYMESKEPFAPYKYTIGKKTVSAKKYKAYVKKITSGSKGKSFYDNMHKNTKANRARYL